MKFPRLLSVLCFVCLSISGKAQQDTAYIYTYGGEKDEQGRDIQLTTDSGFIMVGSTSSFGKGNSDIYLVKVDSSLKYEWSAAIGHQFSEFGYAVKQTTDGGYIIAGMTNSLGNGNYDAYLVRTDDKGQKLWEKTYGGFDWDMAYDVEITSDGGFMVVGETHSLGKGDADAYLIRTDKDGNVVWEKTLGGKKKDIAHALIKTRDGNYAFCGENASKNDTSKGDAWLVKFKEDGSVVFDTTHVLPEYDVAYGLVEDDSLKLVICGKSFSAKQRVSEGIVTRFNEKGEFEWFEYFGGQYLTQTDNFNDELREIKIDNFGEYWSIGSTRTFGTEKSNDFYLVKIDKLGNYITGTTYGSRFEDIGYGIILGAKGKTFTIFGESDSYLDDFYDELTIIQFEEFKETYPEKKKSIIDLSPAGPSKISESESQNNLSYDIYSSQLQTAIRNTGEVSFQIEILNMMGQFSLTNSTLQPNEEVFLGLKGIHLIHISNSNLDSDEFIKHFFK